MIWKTWGKYLPLEQSTVERRVGGRSSNIIIMVGRGSLPFSIGQVRIQNIFFFFFLKKLAGKSEFRKASDEKQIWAQGSARRRDMSRGIPVRGWLPMPLWVDKGIEKLHICVFWGILCSFFINTERKAIFIKEKNKMSQLYYICKAVSFLGIDDWNKWVTLLQSKW